MTNLFEKENDGFFSQEEIENLNNLTKTLNKDEFLLNNVEVENDGENKKNKEKVFEANFILDQIKKDATFISNMPKDNVFFDLFRDYKTEFSFLREKINKGIKIFEENEEKGYLEIKRYLHSFKGGMNTIGLSRLGKEIHFLETMINELLEKPKEEKRFIFNVFKKRIEHVFFSYEEKEINEKYEFIPFEFSEIKQDNLEESYFNKENKKEKKYKKEEKENILVPLEEINQVIDRQNIAKIINSNLISENISLKTYLEDLDEVILKLQKNIKELEDYSEGNIKSNITESKGSRLDPLLMDQFTKLQEYSRSLIENLMDLEDIKKNLKNKAKDQQQYFNKISEITNYSLLSLTQIRLVDFSSLSQRFKMACELAAKELGKNINFKVIDNGVKVDITLTNQIKGVVELIIKNSIAHGIEDSVKERRKKGKPDYGNITIEVKQLANSFLIILKDDGKGLDIEKIRRKAIEKGIVKKNETFNMEDAIHCVLQSGFSTADKVGNIAGRGVGLDSVQDQILKLGGSFNIKSEKDKGMSVILSIPTSYTTTYGLIVKVSGEKIVILNSLIKEIVSLNKQEFEESQKNNFFIYDDEKIDFRKLKNIINLKSVEEDKKLFYKIIILEQDGIKFAIAVDDILENREILIKNINSNLKGIPGLIGVTTLVDGSPSYVFNPISCKKYEMNKRGIKNFNQLLPYDVFSEIQTINNNEFFIPNILIVDDSVVIRKHTERFLDNYGFKHVSAKNGKEAIDKLLENNVDLILLDIEMPEMNGFEFTETIKQNEKYKNIPIVMITSRSNNIHKEKAKNLGINEYMIKPFSQQELLKYIKKYGYK